MRAKIQQICCKRKAPRGFNKPAARRAAVLPLVLAVMMIASALQALGADFAVLHNGFSIRHERREVIGAVTRLYVTADGRSYVDVPTADIDHFEKDFAPPPAQVPLGNPAPAQPVSAPVHAPPNASVPIANAAPPASPALVAVKPHADLNTVVSSSSNHYNLDPDLINSVIRAESGFNSHAVSPKGAQGLMQLMPKTATGLGVKNAFDPQSNVEAGTAYLRALLEFYHFDLVKALAAYNAGPQRITQYKGVPPYSETKAYIARIIRDYNRKKLAEQKAAAAAKPQAARTSAKPGPGQKNTAATAQAAINRVQDGASR